MFQLLGLKSEFIFAPVYQPAGKLTCGLLLVLYNLNIYNIIEVLIQSQKYFLITD